LASSSKLLYGDPDSDSAFLLLEAMKYEGIFRIVTAFHIEIISKYRSNKVEEQKKQTHV
jgi:hypothetical protein